MIFCSVEDSKKPKIYKNSIDKKEKKCYTVIKTIEAHLNISSRRAKACAGVAAVKGFGAEGDS